MKVWPIYYLLSSYYHHFSRLFLQSLLKSYNLSGLELFFFWGEKQGLLKRQISINFCNFQNQENIFDSYIKNEFEFSATFYSISTITTGRIEEERRAFGESLFKNGIIWVGNLREKEAIADGWGQRRNPVHVSFVGLRFVFRDFGGDRS